MMQLLRASAAAALVSACSSPAPAPSGPVTFQSSPYVTTTSNSGALVVQVRTSPQPPAVGTNAVQLQITNASDGTPVDGLTLDVEPWMPSMEHGTSVPTIAAQGNGQYLVTEVYLYMQGVWLLRTTVSGGMSDYAAPQLEVQ